MTRAGATGCVLAVLLGGTACLLPQEDHVNGVAEPARNRPPQILESLVQPSGRFVTVQNGAGCPNLAFSAPISDPDEDLLTYDFFVDPDSNAAFVKQGQLPDGGAQGANPATYEVSFTTAGPLQAPGQHVVELLVADGQLANRESAPRPVKLADGGFVLEPTYVVTYVWVVTVVAGPCP